MYSREIDLRTEVLLAEPQRAINNLFNILRKTGPLTETELSNAKTIIGFLPNLIAAHERKSYERELTNAAILFDHKEVLPYLAAAMTVAKFFPAEKVENKSPVSRPVDLARPLPKPAALPRKAEVKAKPKPATALPKAEVKAKPKPATALPKAEVKAKPKPATALPPAASFSPPSVQLFPTPVDFTPPGTLIPSECLYRRVVRAAGADKTFTPCSCKPDTLSICDTCSYQKNFSLPLERTRYLDTAKVVTHLTPLASSATKAALDPARMAIFLFAAADSRRLLFGTAEQMKSYDDILGVSPPRAGFAHFEWSSVLKHMVVVAVEKFPDPLSYVFTNEEQRIKNSHFDEMSILPEVKNLLEEKTEVPMISAASPDFERIPAIAIKIAFHGFLPATHSLTSEESSYVFGYYPVPSVTSTPSFYEFSSTNLMMEFTRKLPHYVGVLGVRRANQWQPVMRFQSNLPLRLNRPFEQPRMMDEMAKRLWAAVHQDDITPFYRKSINKGCALWQEKLTDTSEGLEIPFWGKPIVGSPPRLQWKDLIIKEIRLIGRGGFGDAWLLSVEDPKNLLSSTETKDSESKIRTVVAKAPLDTKDPETCKAFQKELRMMAKLKHPNIVNCFGYIVPDEDVADVRRRPALLLQHGGKDARQFLKSFWTPVNLETRLQILLQVFEAVAHMHSQGYIHGDLKTSNFLVRHVGDKLVVTLIDLGFATTTHDAEYNGGTKEYKAPELLLRDTKEDGHLTMACDAYSLGVLMLEVLCDRGDPWRNLKRKHLEAKLRAGDDRVPLKMPSEAHAPFYDIARLLLNPDPNNRINVFQAKSLIKIAIEKHLRSVSPTPPALVELNQKEMAERILQLAGFGSGPLARGITMEYFLDSVVCAVKFWPHGKVGITAGELAEHCKRYLSTAEFKMRGNTVYINGMEDEDYRNLHALYQTDLEGMIGIVQFVHVFLYLNRPLLSSQDREREEPTLKETLDLIYNALIGPAVSSTAPLEAKERSKSHFFQLATDADLFAPRENAEQLLADKPDTFVIRPTTGCVETVKGQYVSYGLNLVLSVQHKSGLFWHQLLVDSERLDPALHGGKAACFVDSKGMRHFNLDFLDEKEIQYWRTRELEEKEKTSSWSAARYRKHHNAVEFAETKATPSTDGIFATTAPVPITSSSLEARPFAPAKRAVMPLSTLKEISSEEDEGEEEKEISVAAQKSFENYKNNMEKKNYRAAMDALKRADKHGYPNLIDKKIELEKLIAEQKKIAAVVTPTKPAEKIAGTAVAEKSEATEVKTESKKIPRAIKEEFSKSDKRNLKILNDLFDDLCSRSGTLLALPKEFLSLDDIVTLENLQKDYVEFDSKLVEKDKVVTLLKIQERKKSSLEKIEDKIKRKMDLKEKQEKAALKEMAKKIESKEIKVVPHAAPKSELEKDLVALKEFLRYAHRANLDSKLECHKVHHALLWTLGFILDRIKMMPLHPFPAKCARKIRNFIFADDTLFPHESKYKEQTYEIMNMVEELLPHLHQDFSTHGFFTHIRKQNRKIIESVEKKEKPLLIAALHDLPAPCRADFSEFCEKEAKLFEKEKAGDPMTIAAGNFIAARQGKITIDPSLRKIGRELRHVDNIKPQR